MGPETAQTRLQLMDATETVMRDEGYAAVTSRRVAEGAGVNQQTVYYYFETMDDLLVATYRRRIQKMEDSFEQALSSDHPLQAFWKASSEPNDAALTLEYLALSNHNALIRHETVEFGERSRRLYADRLAAPINANNPAPDVATPFAVVMAITYVAHLIGFEQSIGLQGGHAETTTLMNWCLSQLEPRA
ncbi:MAG: regulatory protein TetR [Novosphingobium sp.]|nr:regulatory protein TetR [Novosphingobium sp.]